MKKAEKFIRYKNQYIDVDFGERVERDPVEKEINREYFPLNYKAKINKRDPEIFALLEKYKNSQILYFRYYGFDAKEHKIDSIKMSNAKLDLFYGNFINEVYLAPNNADFEDEEILKSLYSKMNYAQALAFYNWKFPISKVMSFTKSWTQYIFPSEEQYGYLQRGELDKIQDIRVSIPIQAVQVRVVLKQMQ